MKKVPPETYEFQHSVVMEVMFAIVREVVVNDDGTKRRKASKVWRSTVNDYRQEINLFLDD